MKFLFLEVCLILFLECLCEESPIKVNDICTKSPEERQSSKYIFDASIPNGPLPNKSLEYTNISEEVCFGKCCDNSLCNVVLYLKSKCVAFECDLHNFDQCMPKKTFGIFTKTAKLFLLRVPLEKYETLNGRKVKRIQKVDPSSMMNTLTPTPIKKLTLEISRNQTLTLPINYVTLTANVLGDQNSTFEYQWTLLSTPPDKNTGKMDTTQTKELKLTDLSMGDYQFQVEVHGSNSYGKGIVWVFVKSAMKPNKPPVAVIIPKNQTVQLPNNVILDGSKSTDDDKIDSYYWELIKGPLEVNKKIKNDQSMLNLENLLPGSYIFKLTVKDVTGASSFDMANLTVVAEKDYPPQADPGPNIIVELPVKYVILNGSSSRDDKKIVSYQWTKKFDGLTADIQGVRDPFLNLTNLQEGTYTFNLKVTDSLGQSSDKDVQVFVKPRMNSHPIARASVTDEKSVTVRLPATEAVLNGSLSSDDDKITKFLWKQIQGAATLNLVDADKPIAYVYDLKIGTFQFNLTVYDKEQLSSSDTVTLRITESKNQGPVAKIAEIGKYYHLGSKVVKIDGSKSWDDHSIVQYKWTREDLNVAFCTILEDSDSSPVLLLTDLLPGMYRFKFKVVDIEGAFDSVLTTLTVHPPKNEKYLVELQFHCSLPLFTEFKKKTLLSNIKLMVEKKLNTDMSKVFIHLVKLDKVHFQNRATIVFFVSLNKESTLSSPNVVGITTDQKRMVTNGSTSTQTSSREVIGERYIGALKVVEALNELRYNSFSMEYRIVRIDTYVCQNNCSNHGRCDEITKLCQCQTFWMASFFRERFGDGRPNCDWSIIYLIIFIFISVFSLCLSLWICLRLRRRCRPKNTTKGRKHKYARINDYDYDLTSKLPKSLSNGIKCRITAEKLAEYHLNTDSTSSSDDNASLIRKHHRKNHHPIKRSSSFTSINGNTLKTP